MPSLFKLGLVGVQRGFRGIRRRWQNIAIGLFFVAGASAEEAEPKMPLQSFERFAPLPGVVQAAKAAHLELSGLAPIVTRKELKPGDSVTVLVNWTKDKELKQWVVTVEAIESEKAKTSHAQAVLYTSSGHEFAFGSDRTALEITLLGPLRKNDEGRAAALAPEIKRQRITVSSEYLALGLERVPALMLRLQAMRKANPLLPEVDSEVSNRPFPAARVAAGRRAAEAIGITETDERAHAGSILALMEFFQITSRTPGLQDVLMSVMDVPWWSILTSGGKMPVIKFETLPSVKQSDSKTWGSVYANPLLLHLNGKPALLCHLFVVAPQPPLLVTAGIVGLVAVRPDGKGPMLTLGIVSSHVAADKTAP